MTITERVRILRSKGYTYQEIATKVGSTKASVKRIVSRLLKAGLVSYVSRDDAIKRRSGYKDSRNGNIYKD